MILCISCKNKTSTDRCTNTALSGLSLCGKHVKVKAPRLWNVINGIDKQVTLISKVWKGYFIRKRLRLSGPGVLNRTKCINKEELISFEDIKTVTIFDYFGFEENTKIYGFDIRTILDVFRRNLIPINPYTRQPISISDRKRLRELYAYRIRNKLQNLYENNSLDTVQLKIENSWRQISQIAEENGFYDVNPNLFLGLNKTQLYIFLSMIHNDLKTWAAEHKFRSSKRLLYIIWTHHVLKKFSNVHSISEYSFFVSSILLSILYDSVEPYNVCFIIMSALYRL